MPLVDGQSMFETNVSQVERISRLGLAANRLPAKVVINNTDANRCKNRDFICLI